MKYNLKKRAIALACAGVFMGGMAAPVMDFLPEAAQMKAEAARKYVCGKCMRTATANIGSPSPGNCPKGGVHNWVYTGETGGSSNSSSSSNSNANDGFPATSHGKANANSESWWNLRPNPENVFRIKGNNSKRGAQNVTVHIKNKGKYDVRVRLDVGFFKPNQKNNNRSDFTLKPGQGFSYTVKPGNATRDVTFTKIGSKTSVVDITVESKKRDGFTFQKIK